MLILAGVSLNAIVGENGIVTMAQKAKAESEKASIMEQIENKLVGYNIDLIADDSKTSAKTAINKLLSEGIVDSAMSSNGSFVADTTNLAAVPLTSEDGSWRGEFEYVVEKNGYRFNVYQDRDGTYTVGESDIVSGEATTGGNVTSGKTLVTSDAFTANDEGEDVSDNEKGKYTIVGDASVIFADKINGNFSIHVSGTNVTATVSIFDDMTLSNKGLQRSAIDVDPSCTLNLWIADGAMVTVDSGSGINAVGEEPGKCGYAGIHIPWKDENEDGVRDRKEYAVLNLKGEGTIKAIAGNASNAGYNNTSNIGGPGGGGAGAGIGGNGGNGGTERLGRGNPGYAGENCGEVNIYDSLTVFAYGGAGSSGAPGAIATGNAGGGGGYPGAGIGRRRCWPELVAHAVLEVDGYSAGGSDGQFTTNELWSNNGLRNYSNVINEDYTVGLGGWYHRNWSGGSYFEGMTYGNDLYEFMLGGVGNYGSTYGHEAGNGGIGGKGGIITVHEFKDENGNVLLQKSAKVYAYNGNKYTDGTSYNNGQNECPSWGQCGIYLPKYSCKELTLWTGDGYVKCSYEETEPRSTIDTISYINTLINEEINLRINATETITVNLNSQGIGTGLGYTELDNGSYNKYEQKSDGTFLIQ